MASDIQGWSFTRDELVGMSAVELLEQLDLDELIEVSNTGKDAIGDVRDPKYLRAHQMCDNLDYLRFLLRQIHARRNVGIKVDSAESKQTLKALTDKLHLIGSGIIGKTPYKRSTVTFENNPDRDYDVVFGFELDGGYRHVYRATK